MIPQDPPDKFCSTARGEPGILVDVHPSLLVRKSDSVAAITFPESARVNNLLRHHN
jgi:hypothetical protein